MTPVSKEPRAQPWHRSKEGLRWQLTMVPTNKEYKNHQPMRVSAKHGMGSGNAHGDRDGRLP